MPVNEDVEAVVEMMDAVLGDRSVPRNIRAAVEAAKQKILAEGGGLSVGVTAAIYELDDISNDINMPPHTRTEIWSIISELERIREQCK